MIIPALLTGNERIAEERISLAKDMSGWLHIDILDNSLYKFEGLSLEQLKEFDYDALSLELHCMTDAPDKVLNSGLPIERMIIHYEVHNWDEFYESFAAQGIDTWVAVDPSTPVDELELPEDVGGIVVMGVMPGQSGQDLRDDTFERLAGIKEHYPDLPITVDGGVKEENIRELISAGVDNIVMGSALFGQKDPLEAYKRYVGLSDPITSRMATDEASGEGE